METVKDIKDFKRFIELNRDKLYARAENANDIAIDDDRCKRKIIVNMKMVASMLLYSRDL